jgi:uncharacterized membrane protein YgcG
MKKFWKILVLTLIAVFTAAAITTAAPNPIVDQNKALSKQDTQAITGRINELNRKHNISIGVLLITVPDSKQSGSVASGFLTQGGYDKATKGGIVLLLDMKGHNWYIATDKKLGQAITPEYGVKRLGTNIVANLKKNDTPAPAIRSFLTGIDTLTEYYEKNGKAMTKEDETKAIAEKKEAKESGDKSPGIISYLVGLVASIGAAFGYRSNLRSKMSNVATASEALDYVDEEGLNMLTSTDEFDHSDIERTPRAKSSTRETKEDVTTESHDDEDSSGGGGKW